MTDRDQPRPDVTPEPFEFTPTPPLVNGRVLPPEPNLDQQPPGTDHYRDDEGVIHYVGYLPPPEPEIPAAAHDRTQAWDDRGWAEVPTGPAREVPYGQDVVDRPDDLEVVTQANPVVADAATFTPLDEMGAPLRTRGGGLLGDWLGGPLHPPGAWAAERSDDPDVAAMRDRVIRAAETERELQRAYRATPEGQLDYAWLQLRDDVGESTSALRQGVVLAGYAAISVARVLRLAPRVAVRTLATVAVRSLL